MNKHLSLVLIINFFIFCPLHAAVYIEQPTVKLIQNSDLIIEGRLMQKFTDEEHYIKNIAIYKKDGSVEKQQIVDENGIITTYVLKVSGILYGNYNNKEIEIKMEGGCYGGYCLEIGTNYELEKDKEYVIFLKFDENNNSYIASAHAYSVFELLDNKVLKRMTDSFIPNIIDKVENDDSNQELTVKGLEELINSRPIRDRHDLTKDLTKQEGYIPEENKCGSTYYYAEIVDDKVIYKDSCGDIIKGPDFK